MVNRQRRLTTQRSDYRNQDFKQRPSFHPPLFSSPLVAATLTGRTNPRPPAPSTLANMQALTARGVVAGVSAKGPVDPEWHRCGMMMGSEWLGSNIDQASWESGGGGGGDTSACTGS